MGTTPERSQGGHWSGPGPPCRCTVWRQMLVYIYICVCGFVCIYCNRVVLVALSGDLFFAMWPPSRDVFREEPVLLWDFFMVAPCLAHGGDGLCREHPSSAAASRGSEHSQTSPAKLLLSGCKAGHGGTPQNVLLWPKSMKRLCGAFCFCKAAQTVPELRRRRGLAGLAPCVLAGTAGRSGAQMPWWS